MSGFSQYSQIVKPSQYEDPINREILLKGAVYKEQNIEKGVEATQNLIDAAYNMPSLPGEDTRVKNEIVQNMMKQASNLAYSDFANPSTTSQLKGYISQVSNSPDMKGIIERGTALQKMLADKKAAEAKGQGYYNYGFKEAAKYMNDGLYLKDARFNNSGGNIPEIEKLKSEALKNVPKIKIY